MESMTPEERFERIERQLEFLAGSQAQHDARMAEHARQMAENARQIAENSRQIGDNSRQILDNSRQIGELSDLTLRIGRIVEEQARRLDVLADSQRRTDERLNTLISVVERYFGNGRK
jgi:methyl-accepting chemotaxis protein